MGAIVGFNAFLFILTLTNTYTNAYDIYNHSEILSYHFHYNISLLSKLVAYSNIIL